MEVHTAVRRRHISLGSGEPRGPPAQRTGGTAQHALQKEDYPMVRKTIFACAAALCVAASAAPTNASAASAAAAFRASTFHLVVGGASRLPARRSGFGLVIDRRPVPIKDRFYRSKPHVN
jgi:hypothetical protein